MKAKRVKRQVQSSRVRKPNGPIVINTSPSDRKVKRGGCCGKKRA
ncbi:hypothetical protein [Halobacillus litoralis]|nr:hypothetical protein [Halobacillus litoralis]